MKTKTAFAWMTIVSATFMLLTMIMASIMLGSQGGERGTTEDYHIYYSAYMAGKDWRDYRSPFGTEDII